MPYINQERGDVRCGAYAVGYWLWECGVGHPYADIESYEDDVHEIYCKVRLDMKDMSKIRRRFNENMCNMMRGFSNPFKISDYLNNSELLLNTKVKSADANIIKKLQVLGGNVVVCDKISDLKDNEKAILIMGEKVNGQFEMKHYVFAVGNNEIRLSNGRIGMTVIDPKCGEHEIVNDNLETLKNIDNLSFLKTVIRN